MADWSRSGTTVEIRRCKRLQVVLCGGGHRRRGRGTSADKTRYQTRSVAMSKVAYIAMLAYIPALIFFMCYTADSKLADCAWFVLDKVVLLCLLLALRNKEIIEFRRRFFLFFAIAICIYVVYLIIDFSGYLRNSLLIVSILSICYILSILFALKNDR
jgi:bacteriorhodopsin